MNIFFFSSSRITRAIVFSIEYVLNISIKNIVVLKENHTLEDFSFSGNKIILCDNLLKALSLSDIIIIVDNGRLPEHKTKYIEEYGIKNCKRVVFVNGNLERQRNFPNEANQPIFGLPTIINIGIGDASLTYCLEMYLNRFFHDKGVNIYQRFTQYTKNIIDALQSASLINQNLLMPNELNDATKSSCDLYIESIYFDNIHLMLQSLESIGACKPDYVVFNGNARFEEQYDLASIFKYRFGCNVYTVKSKYLDIHKDEYNYKLVLCPSLRGSDYIGDEGFCKEFDRNFNANLAFPETVCII